GPRGAGQHVAGGSVLLRHLIPRLGGTRGQAAGVADPRDLRSLDRAETGDLAAHRGLEARRRHVLGTRGSGPVALSARVLERATSVQASPAFLAGASGSTERGNRKIPTRRGGESSSR